MEQRIARLRNALATHGADACFSFARPANQYLSGFMGSTSAVVVSASEAFFLCDFRYIEQVREQVEGFEILEVAGSLETEAADRLRALAPERVVFDPAQTTFQQADKVQTTFGGTIEPAAALFATLREVKDLEEIARIRAASELAEDAMLELARGLEEGVTEREAAARLEYEFKRRGASGASFDPIVLFGARSSLPHGQPSEKRLEPGDIVLIDCGCRMGGYCSDLTRTYAYAKIPDRWFAEIYAAVLAAQETGLAAVRAGAACSEVDAASRRIIHDAGFGAFFGHGLGHGVGVEIHESPRLNKESASVLAAGMVVTVEPGIYLPSRGGVRIEDLVVVTETGCEVLTRAPKQLEVLHR